MSLAGVDEDLTDEVYSTIKELKDKLSSKGKNVKSSKKDFLSSVIGSQPSEVIVFPPKSSRNKGCGKRIMSSMETSEKEKKKARMCKTCALLCNHDSRNCTEFFFNVITFFNVSINSKLTAKCRKCVKNVTQV